MRRTTLTAALLSATLLLAGCGGSKDEEPQADPAPSATQEPAEPVLWPLTGLEAEEGDAVDGPVLVAKIDNSGKGAQVGLKAADMIVEELVEGRTTRLAAFYQSKLPKEAGPIRSMRASDIGIVSPVDAQIITSGAAGETIARIRKAGITFHEEGATGIYRDRSRYAPYNLMANLKEVAGKVKPPKERPTDYFTFGTPEDLPAGEPGNGLVADFGNHQTSWAFEGGTYRNTNSFAVQGQGFKADSVLVLRVETTDAGYKDPSGAFVPETLFKGQGEAHLFHDGKVVNGTWKKAGLDGDLELSTPEGELTVPAGRTWVELLPVDGKLTVNP